VRIDEEIAMYTSSGSGAYLFRPSGNASPVVQPGGLVLVSQGPLMEEVFSVPKFHTHPPLVRSARLYAGKTVQAAAAEFEYYVDFARNEFNDRELITRFKTELNNNRLFYTDLNGFQTMRRETYSKIPLQGNYYPMPSLAFLQCPGGRRFSLHSRQALGVASLNKGELEIMLDRRLIHDDGRGLGQGIMDNRPSRVVFQLLVERNTTASSPGHPDVAFKVPSLLSHLVNARLNYPVHAFFDTPQAFTNIQATTQSTVVDPNFAPLRGDLPCDLHIVAMKLLRPSQPASDEDLSHGVLLHRRGVDSSYSMSDQLMCQTMEKRSFDLFALFSAQVDINKLRKASLSFTHNDGSEVVAQRDVANRKLGLGGALTLRSHEMVDMNAMEIQAYKFDLTSVG
jgi:alpha-mannosidase II